MIAVIDYRAGNSQSVGNALRHIGVPHKLVNSADGLSGASGIILPGVGSADETMRSLAELGLIDTLRELSLDGDTPFLGICVGMQVLFGHSEEGDTPCLGWFEGRVVRYAATLRVPQIGWNRVSFLRSSALNAAGESEYLYFVNSYHCVPSNTSDTLATADYGGDFCALVNRGNIYGSQCHLEKSGETGLALLKRFAQLCQQDDDKIIHKSNDTRDGGAALC